MTLYLRPLSLVYGPDARQAIEARRGGALGGSDFIGKLAYAHLYFFF